MRELVKAVKQWGVDKGLHKVGHLAQAKYTLKEVAELLDAYADNDLPAINDAIGDIAVTLIVGASNDEEGIYDCLEHYLSKGYFSEALTALDLTFKNMFATIIDCALELKERSFEDTVNAGDYNQLISSLDYLLQVVNRDFDQKLSLKDCLQLAYNEIKDRKGYTDENGHFIKEN